MSLRIDIDTQETENFCRQHHIRRLAFFGSVLTDRFGPDSDVDVPVEFESGHRVGLLGMAAIEAELSQIIGRKVDLRTPQDLSRYFPDEVLAAAEMKYAA